jgi:metallo-beta-lactamase family protein
LHDSEDDGEPPIYLAVDVAGVMTLFEPVEYKQKVTIAPGVTAEFYDAGHILGSASVIIEADGKKICFSGDIGNHPVPILRPPETPPAADIVVMEATYGGRTHETSLDRRQKLRSVIRKTAQKGGVLMIPAFALERTQELLYELNQLIQEDSIPALPIFLDSPLAIAATNVYHQYERYYDDDALLLKKNGGELFTFPMLKITETGEQSKAIKEVKGPKIIVAGSGMMEGGRILFHARDFLPESSTTLLIVGYQAEGTLGRKLYEGERRVKIKDKQVHVKGHIAAIGAYSAHADQPGLIEWLGNFKQQPKQVFLVHTEEKGAKLLAKELESKHEVTIPTMGQKVEI